MHPTPGPRAHTENQGTAVPTLLTRQHLHADHCSPTQGSWEEGAGDHRTCDCQTPEYVCLLALCVAGTPHRVSLGYPMGVLGPSSGAQPCCAHLYSCTSKHPPVSVRWCGAWPSCTFTPGPRAVATPAEQGGKAETSTRKTQGSVSQLAGRGQNRGQLTTALTWAGGENAPTF